MTSKRMLIFAIVTCSALVAAPARADKVIPVPQGWKLDLATAPRSLGPTGAAVVVHKLNPSPPPYYQSMKVLQIVNGAVFSENEFSGNVFKIEYSPNGQFLLVHEQDPSLPWPQGSRHLVRLNGNIQWTKQDNREFWFSADGNAVLAATLRPMTEGHGESIEVFSLTGTSLGVFKFGKTVLGAAVFDSGDTLVVAVGHTVFAQDLTTSPPSVVWQTDFQVYDERIVGLTATSESRIVVEQAFGRFIVLDAADGSLLHRYNTEDLAANDPNMTMGDYGGYKPFESSGSSNTFSLMNKDGDALSLDLVTGTLAPLSINTSRASTCVLRQDIRHDTILVLCPDQIRIRKLN